MNKKMFCVLLCLTLIMGISAVIPFSALKVDQVYAQATALEYTLTGGEFVPGPFGGDSNLITGGCMYWQLFDVLPHGDGQRAVYGVTGLSIDVLASNGIVHMLTVVPDGLPSPFFYDPEIPDLVQDSGIVNVFSDGFIDMTIYDLSIDGQSVDQQDIIGGPAFVGSSWTGVFPEPASFSVNMLAGLPSLGFFGEVSLTGELSACEEPVAATIRIEPERLNLNSKGFFTAFITLPEEYDVGDIDVSTVECEGASAINGMVSKIDGNTFIAVFNRQDLVNITVGDAVSLKIIGKVSDNGNLIDFEGCDTIRVISKGK